MGNTNKKKKEDEKSSSSKKYTAQDAINAANKIKSGETDDSSTKKYTADDAKRVVADREFQKVKRYINSTADTLSNVYSGWHNESEMENYSRQLSDYQKVLSDFNSKYGSYYSGMKDLTDTLNGTLSNWDALSGGYSYYQNKEAYDTAMEKAKNSYSIDLYDPVDDGLKGYTKKYMENDDFEDVVENSRINAKKNKIDTTQLDNLTFGLSSDVGYYILEKFGADSDEYKNFIKDSEYYGSTQWKYDLGVKAMTDYANGNADAVPDWIKDIYDEEGFPEWMRSGAFTKILGVGAPIAQILANPLIVGQKLIQGDEYDPYSGIAMVSNLGNEMNRITSQTIADNTNWKIGDTNVPSYLFDTIWSSGIQSYLGAAQFGWAYTPLMGANAYNSTYKEAIERGVSPEEANKTAWAAGISEAAFETLSIGAFKAFQARNVSGFKDWIFNFFSQAFVEGTEEVTTELANTFTDNWINGELSKYNQNIARYKSRGFSDDEAEKNANWDLASDIGQAFVGGALTGGVMSGVASGVQWHNNAESGQNINRAQYISDMESLGQMDRNSNAYNDYLSLRQRFGENLNGATNAQIGANATNAAIELSQKANKAGKELNKAVKNNSLDYEQRQGNIDNKAYTYNSYASALNNMYGNMNGKFAVNANEDTDVETNTKTDTPQNAIDSIRDRINIADKTANANGEAIKIANVTEEDGNIVVTDENGNKVDASTATFSENDAELMARALDMDEAKRATYLENYEGGNVTEYTAEFLETWSKSENGNSEAIRNMQTNTMSENAKLAVAVQSKTLASQSDRKAESMTRQVVSQAKNAGLTPGNFDSSSVDIDSLNKTQRRYVKGIEAISAVTGIDFAVINNTETDMNGVTVLKDNVTIDGKSYSKGTVVINLSATLRIDDISDGSYVHNTLPHELTHWMSMQMGEEFKILENAVRNSMTAKEFNNLVDAELEADPSLDEKGAIEEVIARSCENMLNNKNVAERILGNIDVKGLQKLKNAVVKFFSFMQEQLGKIAQNVSNHDAARLAQNSAEAYAKIEDAWVDLFNKAIAKQRASKNNTVVETKTEVASETKGQEEIKAVEEAKTEPVNESKNKFKPYIDHTGAKVLGNGMVELDGDVVKEYSNIAPKIYPKDESYSQWTATWVDKNDQRWGWFFSGTEKTLGKLKFTVLTDEQYEWGKKFFDALESGDAEALVSLVQSDANKAGNLLYSKQINTEDKINQSMTMSECKDMIQRAFVLGEIKEWYEGEYKNGDEWLKGEGVDAVCLIIDNEYELQKKFLNKIEGLMNEDFTSADIIEAYLKGTLTGKEKAKAKRLDISKPNMLAKNEFYSPKNIENYKVVYDTANQKITKDNKTAVMKARANMVIFAHNSGASELLGISNTELNKKLRQWTNYSARARQASESINKRAPLQNRWSGIENCSWVNKITVTNEQIEALVGNINGDSDGHQRSYIARTMLALDTHISYKGLSFTFASRPDPKSSSTNGFYDNSSTSITVKYNSPNTVAHEMGHYLDYQWGRDLGFTSPLTTVCRTQSSKYDSLSSESKQWITNFEQFLTKIEDSSDLSSSYTMDSKEVFARFIDKFVGWTDSLAGGHYFSSGYSDKFTNAQFVEFAVLLQERASLQLEQELEDALGDKKQFAQELRDKGWKEDKIKEVLKRLYPSEQNSNNGVAKSTKLDSDGNELTENQAEYFKDSKVRDENGNLIAVYHGTDNTFYTFRDGKAQGWGRGIYLTDNETDAKEFGSNIIKGYANIVNPYDERYMTYSDIEKDFLATNVYKKFLDDWIDENGEDSFKPDLNYIYTEEIQTFNEGLRELGYDGIIGKNSNNINGLEVVVFNSNQVKLTSNQNPTKDTDIRYSSQIEGEIKDVELSQSDMNNNLHAVHDMESVATVSFCNIEVPEKMGDIIKVFSRYMEEQGWDKSFNDLLGNVDITVEGIPDLFRHGNTDFKASVINAIPYVIEQGKVVYGEIDHKGKGYNTLVLAAPITFTGKGYKNDVAGTYYAAVIVKREIDKTTRKQSVHVTDVLTIKKENPNVVLPMTWQEAEASFPSLRQILINIDANVNMYTEDDTKRAFSKQLESDGYTSLTPGKLGFTDERIDELLTDDWYGSSNKNYAQAYITYMNLEDFLKLITGKNGRLREKMDDWKTSESYEFTGRDFDPQMMKDRYNRTPLQLILRDGNTSKVASHEGRHRAAKLIQMGYTEAPVLVFDRWSDESKTRLSSLTLEPQTLRENVDIFDESESVTLTDLIPFSQGNRELIKQKFGSGSGAEMLFSKQISTPADELMANNKNLEKINAKLTEDITRLREMIKLDKTITKGNVLNQKHLDSAARAILKEANSKYDVKELSDDLKEIYGYILENSNKTEPLSMDAIMNKCYDVAKRIVNEASAEKVENPYPKMALQDIRTARISLTDEQIQEAKNAYGDDWRKAFWGRVTIAKDGLPLDSYWQEWSEAYPGLGFDYDTNPNDMITRLSEIYDDLRDASEITLQRDIRNETLNTAYDIYNKFWTVSTVTTTADKQSAEIKRIKNEHRQAINELKTQLKEQKLEMKNAVSNQKLADDIYFKIKEREAVGKVRDSERAKANERVARQKANDMAYYHEMINRLREQKNQKYAELKEFQKQKDAKRKDVAERRAHIAKITEVSKALLGWMNHPNVKNKKLIPETFKEPVSYLINAIDFSSKQMLGLSGGQNAFSPTQKDMSFVRAINSMNELVGNIERMNLEMPSGFAFSSRFYETWASLNKHITELGLNSGQDNAYILHLMSTEDLSTLASLMKEMKRVVTTYNTVLSAKNAHTMDEYAKNTVDKADSMTAKKVSSSKAIELASRFMNYDNALPYYVFKNMGEGAKFIFNQVAEGWNKYAFNVRTIEKYTKDSKMNAKDIKKWESTTHEFEILMRDKEGNATGNKRTIKLTEAQIMSLYCLSKRSQAVNHMLGQGIRIKDISEGKKSVIQTGNVPLTQTELDTILKVVNEDAEMKRVADAIQSFFNTTCKDWGNEISRIRFDLDAFNEENYFPISVDQNAFAPNDRDSIKSIYALLNMSFTKPLAQNSTKPIEISSIFDVYAQHSEEMAKYNALALPVLDMIKWWGYTVRNEDQTNVSVRESLERAYGKGMNSYINHFLADLNAQQEAGRGETIPKAALRQYKVAAVAANLQVALLQPVSYVRASLMVNPKYLAYGVSHIPTGIKEMMEYSGIANWKNMGFYDVNISRGLNSIIRQDDNWKQKITEIGLKPAEYGDKFTWGALWIACKAQTSHDTNYTGKELLEATAKKFNEVCYATQVFDSTLSRSDLMRSQSYTAQVMTAFMSEPTVSYNTLLDVKTQYDNEARTTNSKTAFKKTGKLLIKASFAYLASSALEAVVRASIGKLKDTDDDDEWDELFLTELKSNLLIFNQIPILKDIVAIADDIDGNNTWNNPKRMEYEVFTTWAKAVKYLGKVQEDGLNYKTIYTVAQALSQATGIPISGAMRSFEEIWNFIIKGTYPDLVLE